MAYTMGYMLPPLSGLKSVPSGYRQNGTGLQPSFLVLKNYQEAWRLWRARSSMAEAGRSDVKFAIIAFISIGHRL